MNAPATNPLPAAARPTPARPSTPGLGTRIRDRADEPQAPQDVATAIFLEALGTGQPQVFCARGGSMWPGIPDGTRVELERLREAPALLDVVLLTSPEGTFFLHRVRGVDAAGHFLLLGDHCSRPDGWFPLHQLVAQAQRMDRGAGWEPIPRPAAPPPRWRRAWHRVWKTP